MTERAHVPKSIAPAPRPGLRPRTAKMDALVHVANTSPRFSPDGAAAAVSAAMAARAALDKPLKT